MSTADIFSLLSLIIIAAVPCVLAVTFHEIAHGWTARYLGDPTAAMMGRLSPNPIRHIDPFGTIALPILLYLTAGFAFGAAKPVPVDFRRLNNPKRDMVAVAIAGPAANLAMALFWGLLMRISLEVSGPEAAGANPVYQMARIGVLFNVLLAVFNMIPIPPLDGGRVLRGFVPEVIGRQLDALERFGIIIVFGIIVVAQVYPPITAPLVSGFFLMRNLIYMLVGIPGF